MAKYLLEEDHYYQESTDTERHNEAISDGFTKPKEAQRPGDEKEQSIMQIETQTQTAEGEEDHTDDEGYDLIILKKHGITVRISKNETYSAKDIIPEVIEDVPTELELKETEAIISVGLKMSPSDAMFDSPVRVTMPHCGAFTEPQDAEVFICYRKNDSTKFTAIRSTSLSSPRCVMRDRDLDIYLNHFSKFRIVATLKEMFIGKRVICTPIIPLAAPRHCMPVVYVNVRDHNVAEQIPEGHKAPIPGVQFLVRWKSGGLKISCKESTLKDEAEIIQESEFRHLTVHKVMFEVDTQNITQNEVNLHITLEQSTTKKLIIPMLNGVCFPCFCMIYPDVNKWLTHPYFLSMVVLTEYPTPNPYYHPSQVYYNGIRSGITGLRLMQPPTTSEDASRSRG
ncbi:uncharacterized protein LOC121413106 [Lytechinus variegatus]|uniref:uncharacterized protein LOC121413106 n=1 Tax=Lytechinus variegatus TaxID=7654 RepID=UPI001BB107B9|nr:uncharacterized protein LOC121413106 [Lytechinus variegatus]